MLDDKEVILYGNYPLITNSILHISNDADIPEEDLPYECVLSDSGQLFLILIQWLHIEIGEYIKCFRSFLE